MINRIELCHISANPERLKNIVLVDNTPTYLLFLCQDYIKYLEWKKILTKISFISIRNILTEVAYRLRATYLDLISTLGKQNQSVAWWASAISEQNTLVSHLFLYCCYLQIASDQLNEKNGTLCVVSESWGVLEALAGIARQSGCTVRWISKPAPGKQNLVCCARYFVRIIRWMGKCIQGRIFGRYTNLPVNDKENVIIHTFVDEACFGRNGEFSDRYFPGLSQWLEKHDFNVFSIPVLFNIKRSYKNVWTWFQKSYQEFINPYKYYRLKDYVCVLKLAWHAAQLPLQKKICLNQLDVTLLFNEERKKKAFSYLNVILYLYLPKRLQDKGLQADLVITEFENMIPEKMISMGFKSVYFSVKTIGFQHGALYPLHLCTYVNRSESEYAPLPDRIVCNGPFFRDILIQEGLPEEKLVVGPALRYAYLHNFKVEQPKSSIFVPLPLMLTDGVELLIKITQSFCEEKKIRIFLKPHPMSSPEQYLNMAKIKKIPEHFEFVTGSMSEWLSQSQIVITLSSCTIYEAFAAGVPVVVVGQESALEFNPLGFYSDFNRVFYSPEEIYKETIRLLSLDEKELVEYREKAKVVLQNSFAPLTDELMSVFTGKDV